jgi:hypothetical protein
MLPARNAAMKLPGSAHRQIVCGGVAFSAIQLGSVGGGQNHLLKRCFFRRLGNLLTSIERSSKREWLTVD